MMGYKALITRPAQTDLMKSFLGMKNKKMDWAFPS